jgi:ribosomal-protein-alanine N-acetyltransferase
MIETRTWTKADIAKIAALEKRCFADAWSATELDGCLSLPVYKSFLLEDGSNIIGYACLLTVYEDAEILNIAVAPEFRKRGYGLSLMHKMLTMAKQSGAQSVFLEVRESNEPAKNLYRSLGFEEYGLRKNYYPDGENAILMTKRI